MNIDKRLLEALERVAYEQGYHDCQKGLNHDEAIEAYFKTPLGEVD